MEAYDQRLLEMKESNVKEATSDTDVVDEYCNSPFKEVKGNEGTFRKLHQAVKYFKRPRCLPLFAHVM